MIVIDKEKFERIVLAATSSGTDVFNSMMDNIQLSIKTVEQRFLGGYQISESLRPDIERYVCLSAFYQAIPMLDLVLTSTGFGVVNNQNVSPASKERVSALRESIRISADAAQDRIIDALTLIDGWGNTLCARMLISSLFYISDHLKDYAGMAEATRRDLLSVQPAILLAEEKIRSTISSELYDDLLCKVRTNRLSDHETMLVWSLRKVIGLFVTRNELAAKSQLAEVVNLLENDLERFPIYQNSEAYKVKHFEFYQNAKEDSCYFWG